MDPVTQGLLGGVAAHAVCGRRLPRAAALIGIAGGMAPDLDVLIPAGSDPLGGVSLHRHFTHALAFIPVGGAVAALPFAFWPMFRGRRGWVFAAAIAGYATHGLLDACTTYGTVLLWPFSQRRLAWDLIGIVDPIYTLILLIGLVGALILGGRAATTGSPQPSAHPAARPAAAARLRRSARWSATALAISLAYLGLGALQHHRVSRVQHALADMRGDRVDRGRVIPTPGNLVVWRSLYESEGRLQADAVRLPFWGKASVHPGATAPLLTLEKLEADRGGLTANEVEAFERFAWFADGYVAYAPGDDWRISDWRYCIRPDARTSIWCLRLPPIADRGATNGGVGGAGRRRHRWFVGGGGGGDRIGWLWSALWGREPGFVPLDQLSP